MPVALSTLGFALAIGLLIGLERGWTSRQERPGRRVAGWRTFGLLGLVGGVAALVPTVVAAMIVLIAGAALLLGYERQRHHPDGQSATTTIAALLTLALGYLAGRGFEIEALAVAAVATLLLSMRETLHRWLAGMSDAEARSAARFALIAFFLLPLLPNRAMGPLSALNPRQLGLVVVLVCGLSFAGYVIARRSHGGRGLMMTALCGALVSSTAVTAAFARRINAGEGPAGALVGGIVLASAVAFLRVILLSAVLVPAAVPTLSLVLAPALVIAAIATWHVIRHADRTEPAGAVKLGNPLDLGGALGLAILVAAMSLATRWAFLRYGEMGIAGVIGLTGLADIDAAVLALSAMPPHILPARTAGMVLAGPVILNTLLKAGLAGVLAPTRAGLRAAGLLALCAAAPAAALGVMLC
jgi:uncharacterized membrane protein (DUF4010 family)